MARIYITEFGGISFVGAGVNQKVPVPSLAAILAFNSVTLSTTSQLSAQLQSGTHFVSIVSDTNCWVNFGMATATTTATLASNYIPANQAPNFYAVNPNGYIAGTI